MRAYRIAILALVVWFLAVGTVFAASNLDNNSEFCFKTLPIIAWFFPNGCDPEPPDDSTELSLFERVTSLFTGASQQPSPAPTTEFARAEPTSVPTFVTPTPTPSPTPIPVASIQPLLAGTGISISNNRITNTGVISLTAGDGISLDDSIITNNDRGSGQSIFKNVSVSGQDTLTASSNNDTLTLEAGSGISLTTDKSNRKIIITSTITPSTLNGWSIASDLVSLADGNDDVGIGTTTALGKVSIVGNANEKQLVLRGNSTQTANLFELQNSAGTAVAYFGSGGSLTLGTNQPLTLTANTPSTGSISRLITLKSTSVYDRPWISHLDYDGRHVAATGIHNTNFTDGSVHKRWELKTVASSGGSSPNELRTRLAIDYDADLANVIFGDVASVGIHNDYGDRATWIHRMRDAGNTGSYDIGKWSTELGAADSTVMTLDVKTLNSTTDATMRLFRETQTSGQRRLVVYKGDGTSTETFVINAATGAVSIFTNAETARLGDGTNTSSYLNFQSNRTMAGYDGSYAVLQGGTSKGVKLNVNSSSFGAGTALTVLPTGEVGIATTSPASLFSVGSGSPFQVNSSGAIVAATGMTSSGTVTFSGLNTAGGVVVTNGSGVLSSVAGLVGQCLVSNGSSTPSWASCSTGGSSGTWVISNGAIAPINSTVDLLVGGTSTAAAKFAVINVNSGTPVASISGLLTVNNSAARIQGTQYRTLNIGGNMTGTISLQPNNSTGRVGINTTTPGSELEVFHTSSPELRLTKATGTYLKMENKAGFGSQIADVAATGESLIDLDPVTTDGISKSSVRLFRNVTTTDTGTGFAIYSADGSANIQSFFSAKENSYFNAVGGNFGIGTTVVPEKLTVVGNGDISGDLQIGSGTSGILSLISTSNSLGVASNEFSFHTNQSSGYRFYTGGDLDLTLAANGNLSLGTSNSYGKMTVAGAITSDAEGDIFSQRDGSDNATYPVIARYWTNNGSFPGGTFIFGNGTNAYVSVEKPGSNNVNLFQVRATESYFTGEVGIGVQNPTHLVELSGGAYSDGASWENASDRNLKTGFKDVDANEILSKIDQLPVSEWSYIAQGTRVRHVGPVAQDFYALFGLGANDTSISTIDPAGVALVGIQGLNRKFEQLTVTLATQQVPLPVTSPAPTATAGPMGESTEVKSLSVIEQIQAKGGVIAWASSLFKESVVFEKIATFMSDVVFKGRAKFEQAPEFGHDTAGVAVIKQGADKVAVPFAHGYDRAPQVGATMIAADTGMEAAVFEQDVRFVVTHISAHGFEIKLNKAAPQDISFSWIVVDVAEPTTSVGKEQVVKEVEIVEPSPEIELPEPTTSPSASPEASPSQLPPITPDQTELPLATESADAQ